MGLFKKLNELSPALTLLVVTAGFAVTIGGIVWAAGRWSAQLEAVRDDVQGLHRTVETLQADVRSVQETLPHMVACMIDLQRFSRSLWTNDAGGGRAASPADELRTRSRANDAPAGRLSPLPAWFVRGMIPRQQT